MIRCFNAAVSTDLSWGGGIIWCSTMGAQATSRGSNLDRVAF